MIYPPSGRTVNQSSLPHPHLGLWSLAHHVCSASRHQVPLSPSPGRLRSDRWASEGCAAALETEHATAEDCSSKGLVARRGPSGDSAMAIRNCTDLVGVCVCVCVCVWVCLGVWVFMCERVSISVYSCRVCVWLPKCACACVWMFALTHLISLLL